MQPSSPEKPPRQWAQEIAALPTLADRRHRLNQVPEQHRALVKSHLSNIWARKKQ